MKTKSRIQVSHQEDGVTITIQDELSSIHFHELKMSVDEFHKAFCRQGFAEGQSELRGVDKVGLKMEHQPFEFQLPPDAGFRDVEVAKEIVKREMFKAGFRDWVPSIYFNSQNSFFKNDDGEPMARCIIRRWVQPSQD